jgi:hypothetical protein
MAAGRCPTWFAVCRCWLPVWLPKIDEIREQESSSELPLEDHRTTPGARRQAHLANKADGRAGISIDELDAALDRIDAATSS